jgi:hypothetical protein
MMEIEAISIDILQSELPQTPRPFLEGLDDIRPQCRELLVSGFGVFGVYPVNCRLKRRRSFPEENLHAFPRDAANFLAGLQPPKLETEHIAIVLLCALHVGNWQLRHGPGE